MMQNLLSGRNFTFVLSGALEIKAAPDNRIHIKSKGDVMTVEQQIIEAQCGTVAVTRPVEVSR